MVLLDAPILSFITYIYDGYYFAFKSAASANFAIPAVHEVIENLHQFTVLIFSEGVPGLSSATVCSWRPQLPEVPLTRRWIERIAHFLALQIFIVNAS